MMFRGNNFRCNITEIKAAEFVCEPGDGTKYHFSVTEIGNKFIVENIGNCFDYPCYIEKSIFDLADRRRQIEAVGKRSPSVNTYTIWAVLDCIDGYWFNRGCMVNQ